MTPLGFPYVVQFSPQAITVRYLRRLVTRFTWPTPNADIDFGARQVAGMNAAYFTLVWLCSCLKYRIDVTFWASVKLHSHGNMFVPCPRMNPDVTCYYTREYAILDHSILVSVSCEILKTKEKRKKCKKEITLSGEETLALSITGIQRYQRQPRTS